MITRSLSELVDIFLSNVDKKTIDGEVPVRLCNFTDVYYNWDVTNSDVLGFMKATATEKEIGKFTLREGDVLLTKDSETRDDIGMSCYVSGDLGGALLGYHCALLRPKSGAISGAYLNAYLKSPMARKYFSNQASGSGQRYTLSVDGIGAVKVPLPSPEEQDSISSFLQAISQKIRVNRLSNEILQKIAVDTYIHSFFGRDPNGFFGDLIIENSKSRIQVGDMKGKDGPIPFFTSGDAILRSEVPLVNGRNILLNTGGNADVKFYVGDCSYSTDTWCITGKNGLSDYLYLCLFVIKPELNQKFFKGTGLKHLQKDSLRSREIYIPTDEELKIFNSIVAPCFERISINLRENDRLNSLRNYLLPMLISGQVGVQR